MAKHLKPFTRNCLRSVASLLITWALLTDGGYAGAFRLLTFVGPVYPEMWRRARIQGSLGASVAFHGGRAEKVEILAHDVRSPIRKIENPDLFVETLQKSLMEWRLTTAEDMTINVKIVFRLLESRSNLPSYKYTVKQDDNNLPVEVVVEADSSEIQF